MYCTFQQVRFTVDPPKERARPFFVFPLKGKERRELWIFCFLFSDVLDFVLCSLGERGACRSVRGVACGRRFETFFVVFFYWVTRRQPTFEVKAFRGRRSV